MGKGLECRLEVGVGIDTIELGGFDERSDAAPVPTALAVACKKRVLSVEGERADGVLTGVGLDLDAAVGQEDLQPFPVPRDVAELLAEAGLGRDAGALLLQPDAERRHQRDGALLAHGKALAGRPPADLGLDPVELGDALQSLGRDR